MLQKKTILKQTNNYFLKEMKCHRNIPCLNKVNLDNRIKLLILTFSSFIKINKLFSNWLQLYSESDNQKSELQASRDY